MDDQAIVSTPGGAELATLEAKGLIRLATSYPELEYLFRHWLVQDAAYGSLLKQERRELHRRVGNALEALYPERRSDLAAVLALHFEQAGDKQKAIDYLLAAGRYALERNALREAHSAYQRAAALLPEMTSDEDETLLQQRLEIEIGRAKAGLSFVPAEQVEADLGKVLSAAERLADPALVAQIHLITAVALLLGGHDPAEPRINLALERVTDIGTQLDDPSLRAMPLALMGFARVVTGPIREGVKAIEDALPYMEERHDLIGAAFARGALAFGYAELGEFDKADTAIARAKEMAKQGDLIAQLDADIDESIVRAFRGQLDQAAPLALDCIERAEEMGAAACVMPSAWILGDIYNRQGRYAEAREVLQRGSAVAQVVDRRVWRPTLSAWLGSTAAALGERAAEAGEWEEALATVRGLGNRVGEAGIRWKRAEALVSADRPADALADFEASAATWEQEGARPNLARVLRGWGAALIAAGQRAEGEQTLRRALSLFEEMGIDAEAQAVRLALSGAQPLALADDA